RSLRRSLEGLPRLLDLRHPGELPVFRAGGLDRPAKVDDRLMEGLAPVANLGVDRVPSVRVYGVALELTQSIGPQVEFRLELIPICLQLRVLVRGEAIEKIVGTPAGPSPWNLAHLLIGGIDLGPKLADDAVELLEHRFPVLLAESSPLLHPGAT